MKLGTIFAMLDSPPEKQPPKKTSDQPPFTGEAIRLLDRPHLAESQWSPDKDHPETLLPGFTPSREDRIDPHAVRMKNAGDRVDLYADFFDAYEPDPK